MRIAIMTSRPLENYLFIPMTQELVSVIKMSFVEVAKTSEIPVGKMKHFETGGKEILIANVDGRFYATGDRCSHANARLSMGKLDGTTITCPLHYARFNVTNGELLSGPLEMKLGDMSSLPAEFGQTMARMGEIISKIKTYDLRVYPVKVQGSSILVNVH
jgi:nitrite reductase/ring-hydroxylating ferredoxin subunit